MCPPDLSGIKTPVLLIHGRYDRMVPFEVGIAILSHIADSRLVLLNNCGRSAALREAGRVESTGTRVPARLLSGWHLRARRARCSRRARGFGHAGGYAAESRATR